MPQVPQEIPAALRHFAAHGAAPVAVPLRHGRHGPRGAVRAARGATGGEDAELLGAGDGW